MQKVFYSQGAKAPEKIKYMPLENGKAFVIISHNIKRDKEEECYTADEVQFETELSLDEVVALEDILFENEGIIPDETPSTEDRLEAIEEAIMYLAEVMG